MKEYYRVPLKRLLAAIVLFAAMAPVALGAEQGQTLSAGFGVSSCTMVAPTERATVAVSIVNAPDFCELVSQALADEVFREPIITLNLPNWSYPGSVVTCRLRFRTTVSRITVRNSAAACRWFGRRGTGWKRMAAAPFVDQTRRGAGFD